MGASPHRIAVYCGSRPGNDPAFVTAAGELGAGLAARGVGVVYGGASVGLMGALADAALAAGGEVIGVIPQSLVAAEIAHPGLTDLLVVDGMHPRKAQMMALADGFVALPGGIGTFEEWFEALTWRYLRIHDKPCSLIDIGGYYRPLMTALESVAAAEMVAPSVLAGIGVYGSVREYLETLSRTPGGSSR